MSTRFRPLRLPASACLGVSLCGAAGRDAPPLLRRLGDRCLEKGRTRLVLDLGELSGLGAGAAAGLAELQGRLVKAGGEVVFVAVGPGARHFLGSCFADLPLRCYPRVEEAVAALEGSGAGESPVRDPSPPVAPPTSPTSAPRPHRFIMLEEALACLGAAPDPAAASAAVADLLRAQDLAAEAVCWLRNGDLLLDPEGRAISVSGGLATALLAAGRPLTLLDAAEADLGPAESDLLAGLQPDLLLPLARGGRLEGVVFLRRAPGEPDYGVSESFALDLLARMLADACAAPVAVDPAADPAAAARDQAGAVEPGWQAALADHLLELLGARRPGGPAGVARLRRLAAATARELGLDPTLEAEVAAAALLCDIALLGKPDLELATGWLGTSRWEEYRTHPGAGADLLEQLGAPDSLAAMVRHHHERFNGEGYPGSLAGEDIPIGARIVAAVENWVALTTELPTRPALGRERALAILLENVSVRHDPGVLRALLRVLERLEGAGVPTGPAPAPGVRPPSRPVTGVSPARQSPISLPGKLKAAFGGHGRGRGVRRVAPA